LIAGSAALVVAADRPQSAGAAGEVVLVGAGDIAGCSWDDDEATAQLLDGIAGTVFNLGDNAYQSGTAAEWANCYDPTWGRHKARTMPVIGNHDFATASGQPYYDYFGPVAGTPTNGWYAYDAGSWRVIVLNSMPSRMFAGSPQEAWLRAELEAHTNDCTVAMWHHALWSHGDHQNENQAAGTWSMLYDAGVDLVLNGHEHYYERFVPMDGSGSPDPTGMVQLTVGTGGVPLRPPPASHTRLPTSAVLETGTHGVMKLTLADGGYDFEFEPVAGQTFTDSGSGTCFAGPRATEPPPDPGAEIAADTFERTVTNAWGAADVGGAWLLRGPSADFDVAGGVGTIRIPASVASRAATLTSVSALDAEVKATVATDKAASGWGQVPALVARRVANNTEYHARLRFSGGQLRLGLVKLLGTSTEVALAPEQLLTGLTHSPGAQFEMRLRVSGSNPTTVSARAWPEGAPEPSTWTVTATDSAAQLQVPGSVGVHAYLSSPAANAPALFSFDDFSATTLGGPPPPNEPPNASFVVSCAGLTCTFDASSSDDPDGSIVSYEWEFGDGAVAIGVTAVHAYAAGGDYLAELMVHDDDDAMSMIGQLVSVTPSTTTVLVSDGFDRSVVNGWGAADVGGIWAPTIAGDFSVAGSEGRMSVPLAGRSRTATIGSLVTAADVLSTFSANKSPTGSGIYVGTIGRRTAAGNEYRFRVRLRTTGEVAVSVTRVMSGAEATVTPEQVVPGLSSSAGSVFHVRFVVEGTSPTSLRGRVWADGSTEPSSWTVDTTDATAALQQSGSFGFSTYLSSTTTNAPVVVGVRDFTVTDLT
jgi:hypothetical protein